MLTVEAQDLAVKISQTWRGGPNVAIWEEELIELDIARANTTYVRLRRTESSAPTIARFFAEYRSLRTDPDENDRCPACIDEGWVPADDFHHPDGRVSTQVKPCGCRAGRQAERAHRQIMAKNAGHIPAAGDDL